MKKIEYRGKEQSLGKWCKELGLNYAKIYQRINVLGYSVEEAFEKGTDVGKKKKGMIFGDVHVPYQHPQLIEEIKKNKDVDYIVIGGDLIDCESCSSFPTMNRPTLWEELIATHNFIKEIQEITDAEIYCITGNHEIRQKMDVIKMQQQELQEMIDPQLLRMLGDGFTCYPNGEKVVYEGLKKFNYIPHRYAKLFGNLITIHPKEFSNVPAKISEQAAEKCINEEIMEKGDIIFVHHTHKYSWIVANRRGNAQVIELGCSCKEMDYASLSETGKLSYGKQVNTYALFEFIEDEKINPNDVKICFY